MPSFIIGVVLFKRPDLVSILISYVLGAVLIVYGLGSIIYFSYQKGKNSDTPITPCVTGILLIVFGGVCILFSHVIEQIFRFIIGIYILFAGVNRIIKACDIEDKKSYKFISVLIISLALIVGGFYTILVSNLVFKSIGIILIIYAVLELVNYILLVSDNKEKVHEPAIIDAPSTEKEIKESKKKKKNTTK